MRGVERLRERPRHRLVQLRRHPRALLERGQLVRLPGVLPQAVLHRLQLRHQELGGGALLLQFAVGDHVHGEHHTGGHGYQPEREAAHQTELQHERTSDEARERHDPHGARHDGERHRGLVALEHEEDGDEVAVRVDGQQHQDDGRLDDHGHVRQRPRERAPEHHQQQDDEEGREPGEVQRPLARVGQPERARQDGRPHHEHGGGAEQARGRPRMQPGGHCPRYPLGVPAGPSRRPWSPPGPAWPPGPWSSPASPCRMA